MDACKKARIEENRLAALQRRYVSRTAASTQKKPRRCLAVDIETHGWAEAEPGFAKQAREAERAACAAQHAPGKDCKKCSILIQPERKSGARKGQFGKTLWEAKWQMKYSRVVQMAWVLLDEDAKQLDCEEVYVHLDDDVGGIQPKAEKFHKISDDILASEGMPLRDALHRFAGALCDIHKNGGTLVAHHLEFDAGILREEFLRIGATDTAQMLSELATTGCCTMNLALELQSDLPNAVENRMFGPKLSDAYKQFVAGTLPAATSERTGLHTAGFDAKLAAHLFLALRAHQERTEETRSRMRKLRQELNQCKADLQADVTSHCTGNSRWHGLS